MRKIFALYSWTQCTWSNLKNPRVFAKVCLFFFFIKLSIIITRPLKANDRSNLPHHFEHFVADEEKIHIHVLLQCTTRSWRGACELFRANRPLLSCSPVNDRSPSLTAKISKVNFVEASPSLRILLCTRYILAHIHLAFLVIKDTRS